VAPPPPPTPTPTAVATATPGAFVCPFGKGTGDGENCPVHKVAADPILFQAVSDSVYLMQQQHPEWFIFEGSPVTRVKVNDKDRERFFAAVVDDLNSKGFCAINDGLEIGVKRNNAFSEQYKFWVTRGYVQTDSRMHIATCTPAWF
jgi:hypothetical protein